MDDGNLTMRQGRFSCCVSATAVLQSQRRSVLPQDYWDSGGGCCCPSWAGGGFWRVSVVPVSAAMCPTEDVGRDPAIADQLPWISLTPQESFA
ncbi:hypothetical protein IHE44_0005090 [Lamprotornis superbus]|uniref:Uncharacterized protein n=1 Tax=Lamprotornis superbus TaxID=245042 RepID=A0A835TTC3_9PASS|nr:hypothetical protein IHE44_0005090 [Lamprotornis superbus]